MWNPFNSKESPVTAPPSPEEKEGPKKAKLEVINGGKTEDEKSPDTLEYAKLVTQ